MLSNDAYHPYSHTIDLLIEHYTKLYTVIHGSRPTCTHLHGAYFLVNGVERDRVWLMQEIDALTQQRLSAKTSHLKANRLVEFLRPSKR